MKHSTIVLIFLIISTVSVARSYGQESKELFTYVFVQEDHTTIPYRFPDGVYYSFNFRDKNIDKIFKDIFTEGVQIRDAWFKPYNTSCSQPNSSAHMMVIVHPALAIRVDKRAPQLEQLGFVEIAKPDMGHCSYRVVHYIFSN